MKISSPIMLAVLMLAGCAAAPQPAPGVDGEMQRLMVAAKVPGLALAVIDHGQVVYRHAYGYADVAAARPLRTDTIMYGASLTKAAFAYMVMQLVDEQLLALDAPLPALLNKALPDYPAFADLRDDPRWRLLTPRMLLSHTSGLLNWRFINPDGKLDFKYPPGSRYVYSGEGMQILQIVVEERTGTPLQTLMQQRVFDRFGMRDTSMVWRDDFAGREAVHYGADGAAIAHQHRRRARAAGSMDTTLDDYASFMAGVLRGDGLSARARAEMLSPQMAIVSPQEFPSHWPGETAAYRGIGLSIGLGWPLYNSPLGPAFFKEGNDNGTNNFALGFLRPQRGMVMLSNSSNADRMFFPAVEYIFGQTCLPWFWMNYIPYDRHVSRAQPVQPIVSPGCGQSAALPPH